MIDRAELMSGLYIFKITNPSCRQAANQSCKVSLSSSISHSYPSIFNSSVNNVDEIMLSHYPPGHPNFMYLEKMFLPIFINKYPNISILKSVNFQNTLEPIPLRFHTCLLVHLP